MACSTASQPADASATIDQIRKELPGSAAILNALNNFWRNRQAQATEELIIAVKTLQDEKWTFPEIAWILYGTLNRFTETLEPDQQKRIFKLLKRPLATRPYELDRKNLLLKLSTFFNNDMKPRDSDQ